MSQPEPLARATVVDELEGRLAQQILDGELTPGVLLPPERVLAEAHGVNRTSLRQALGRLERSGLIETRQGSGSRVRHLEEDGGAELLSLVTATPRRDWIGEIFEARRLVGALVARRAADRRSPAHVAALRDAAERIRTATGPADAQRVEVELHRVLAQATGNRVFVLLVNSMMRAYRPLHRRLRPTFADPPVIAAALAPLVEAVAAGEPLAAERAAQDYFAFTEQRMLAELPS
jgi:GntR family transcriptional regulator, transcriptional repressor for pyruvate dehydrogenase complex